MWPFASGGDGTGPLPLFPLKTVLYPGGHLPLKIFEQRYIEMAKSCMKDAQPFGVCLITQGEEVAVTPGAAPEFATVGTLARITDFDMPQLGILHVVTEGSSRSKGPRSASPYSASVTITSLGLMRASADFNRPGKSTSP